MTLELIAAGIGVLLLSAAWYGLQLVALRDLRDRPSVRGDNKLLWAFVILCVPYAGALGYLSFGPTSFLPRPGRSTAAGRVAGSSRAPSASTRPVREPAAQLHGAAVAPTGRPGEYLRAQRSGAGALRPRRLAVDPVIGTDSTELLPSRVSVARTRRPVPDAIRWPGSAIPTSYHSADADLHD